MDEHPSNYEKNGYLKEFRCIIVDALITQLLKQNVLSREHFIKRNDRFELKPDSISRFFQAFSERIETEIRSRLSDTKLTYRKLLFEQANHLARAIETDPEKYKPFSWKSPPCSSS